MKFIAQWSVEHRVTVNLLMIFICIIGLMSLSNMKRQVFPDFTLDRISIQVVYLGASPEEIEEGIVIKIEEKIASVDGIKKIISKAREGLGTVLLELNEDVKDVQKVVDEVKILVDSITNFPEEAEKPIVQELTIKEDAINIAIYGNVSEMTMRRIGEKIRDDLLAYRDISQVNLAGVRDYEITVEISEDNLRRYGLTFDAVARAVKTGSLDLPGGVIKSTGGDVLIRAKGQRYTGREFEGIPLIALPDGTTIRLGDVARIIDGFKDTDQSGRFNGSPAVLIQVRKTRSEDLIHISRIVRAYVKDHQTTLPPGVKMAIWGDLSFLVKDRIDLLVTNGIQGMILVFICLGLFLRMGLAFWVAIGIPFSFLGAFCILNWLDASINMISLFGFIMTLGILVDDAIIIGENIYAHYERGVAPIKAVVNGVNEVGGPVLMAISTNIIAFMPLLFISGIMGRFVYILPVSVIIILAISLFEAFFILPAHLAKSLEKDNHRKAVNKKKQWHTSLLNQIQQKLQYTIDHIYGPILRKIIDNRYITFSIAIGVLMVISALLLGKHVPFVLHPKTDSNYAQVQFSYPLGTPVSVTKSTIKRIEQVIPRLNKELSGSKTDGQKIVPYYFSLIGMIVNAGANGSEIGGHAGQIFLELLTPENRSITSNDVVSHFRKLVGEIPGVEKLIFSSLSGSPAGNPIEIQLIGDEFPALEEAAEKLKAELARYDGTFDISDNFRPGKSEIKLKAKETTYSLGITLADLARQIRQAFYGDEAVRIQRGRDDVKVMVRYSEQERRSLETIEDMRIRGPKGNQIPFSEVAEVTYGRGYSIINRIDRHRQITVISDLDESITNAEIIVDELSRNFLPKLMARYPQLSYSLEGQKKRANESINSLLNGFFIAVLAIYLLLATQFRSYLQPIIIMIAVPFGMVGAVLGHMVIGIPMTLLSIFGIMALSGIVVNDSIILIDFINRAIQTGTPIEKAVEEAGKARFRAVILTSITTIAGLLPLLLERSFQAQFLIPMAVSISFGLLAATVLTLFLVPTLYLIVTETGLYLKGLFDFKKDAKKAVNQENP